MKTRYLLLAALGGGLLATPLLGQPIIDRQPTSQTVSVGASARFQVAVTPSSDTWSYQWWFKDAALDVALNPSATTYNLRLTNVTANMTGDYWVVVTDDNGSVTSDKARLTVDPTFQKIRGQPIVEDVEPSLVGVWWDYDRDNVLDLFVANSMNSGNAGQNSLYHNEGNGTFTRQTNALTRVNNATWSALLADYDNDGLQDLATVPFAYGSLTPQLYRNVGGGAFGAVPVPQFKLNLEAVDGAWSDLDGDGWLDLLLCTGGGRSDIALRNLPRGGFELLTAKQVGAILEPATTGSPSFADFDNDGDTDLYVNGENGSLPSLYRNPGDGVFVKVTLGSLPGTRFTVGGTWADYDNDGFFDLLTTSREGWVVLHRNRAGQDFEDVTTAAGLTVSTSRGAAWGQAWGDFDNDGDLDLFLAPYTSGNLFFENNGDGTFTPRGVGSPLTEGDRDECPVWADYDNDGLLDLFIACGESAPTKNLLYRNNLRAVGNNNHWLKIALRGLASNRDGIGAKIRVKATIGGKEVWQLRQIASNGIFASGPELLAHFGLGDAAKADVIRIEWPSGNAQELTDVEADHLYTVPESSPILPKRPTVSLGGAVTLSATGATAWQWRFNGVDLPGETNVKLTLTNATLAHAGRYSVVRTLEDGSTVTNFAYLSVDPMFAAVREGSIFTDRADATLAAAWGDINNDGLLDLALGVGDETLPYSTQPTLFYLNLGQGRLKRATADDIGPLADERVDHGQAFWADYDNDGYLDYFQPDWGTHPRLWRGGADGKFTKVTENVGINRLVGSLGTWGYTWVDFDRDGHLDLFLTTGWVSVQTVDQFWSNQGNGTFVRSMKDVFTASGDTQYGVFVDYDNDGDQDLHVGANPWGGGRLYRNDGHGGLSFISAEFLSQSSYYSSWGDYDNDGDLDMFSNYVFRNDGGGKMVKTSVLVNFPNGAGNAGYWADFDNDGYLDLYLPKRREMHRNNRDGTFSNVSLGSVTADQQNGEMGAFADCDNNGFLYLVIASRSATQPNYFYLNNGNGNHSLQLRLVGTASNRQGIGARVYAQARIWGKTVRQMREMFGASGFSEPRPHFGLGDATHADLVRIEWPSGIVQELRDVPADQILSVTEPTELVALSEGRIWVRCWKGMKYEVEVSNDLTAWTSLGVFTNETGRLELTDADAAQHPYRFYRAMAR